MDVTTLWRAALLQLVAVALLSPALGLALPHGFFEDWGWVAGPLAWMLCAAFTARALRLPTGLTLLGAALAGLPSVLAVVLGLHWRGRCLPSASSPGGARGYATTWLGPPNLVTRPPPARR